jgi:hypothetical protein
MSFHVKGEFSFNTDTNEEANEILEVIARILFNDRRVWQPLMDGKMKEL